MGTMLDIVASQRFVLTMNATDAQLIERVAHWIERGNLTVDASRVANNAWVELNKRGMTDAEIREAAEAVNA